MKMYKQLFKGLEFIHSTDNIHQDIKTDNIMIDFEFNLKIIDFGLIRREGIEQLAGTRKFSPVQKTNRLNLHTYVKKQ